MDLAAPRIGGLAGLEGWTGMDAGANENRGPRTENRELKIEDMKIENGIEVFDDLLSSILDLRSSIICNPQ